MSASRSVQEWAFEDPTADLEEFGIDAHQDLLVVITSVPRPHRYEEYHASHASVSSSPYIIQDLFLESRAEVDV